MKHMNFKEFLWHLAFLIFLYALFMPYMIFFGMISMPDLEPVTIGGFKVGTRFYRYPF